MDINKKLLALLAVFCIIASAGLVCAEDQVGSAGSDDMGSLSESLSESSDAGDDIATDGSQDGLEPGNGLPLENQTGYEPANTTDNATGNATDNSTGNITGNASGDATDNATGNSTNATATQTLLTTGNPIIALLAVSSILGGYAVIKRNK